MMMLPASFLSLWLCPQSNYFRPFIPVTLQISNLFNILSHTGNIWDFHLYHISFPFLSWPFFGSLPRRTVFSLILRRFPEVDWKKYFVEWNTTAISEIKSQSIPLIKLLLLKKALVSHSKQLALLDFTQLPIYF